VLTDSENPGRYSVERYLVVDAYSHRESCYLQDLFDVGTSAVNLAVTRAYGSAFVGFLAGAFAGHPLLLITDCAVGGGGEGLPTLGGDIEPVALLGDEALLQCPDDTALW
jgi:hypothetical protein